MEPYQAPSTGPDRDGEADLAAVRPPIYVPIGGALFGASGFFLAGSGLQLFVFFYLTLPLKVVALLLVLLGFVAIAVAPFVMKGRAWAAIGGSVAAAFNALFSAGWCVYALTIGLFSPMMLLAAFLAGLSLLAVPLTIVPSLRASAARKALYS